MWAEGGPSLFALSQECARASDEQQRGSVPGEVRVRGQGVDDEAREAWGAAPCGLSGHPQVCAFVLNDKESPQRASNRGGT